MPKDIVLHLPSAYLKTLDNGFEFVHSLAQLDNRIAAHCSLTLVVDMSDGGGIAMARGLCEWLRLRSTEPPRVTVRWVPFYFFEARNIHIHFSNRLWSLKASYDFLNFDFHPAFSLLAPTGVANTKPQLAYSANSFSKNSISVYGTKSSVGKGTVCLLLGLAYQKERRLVLPFKALSGNDILDTQAHARHICPSTLVQWRYLRRSSDLPLPDYLSPIVLSPDRKDGKAGLMSLFSENGGRLLPYTLEEMYSDGLYECARRSVLGAWERTVDLASKGNAIVVAEGAGSPLDFPAQMDLANAIITTPHNMLVTSHDVAGVLSLLGTLTELRESTSSPEFAGVVSSQTTRTHDLTCDITHTVAEICEMHSMKYIGIIPYNSDLRDATSEDAYDNIVAAESEWVCPDAFVRSDLIKALSL